MNNLLIELEKKNQEYQFNYNCLSPLEKKDFLIWIGSYYGYDTSKQSDYRKNHDRFYKKIKEYYNRIQESTINKDELLEQLLEIPANKIPNRFKALTYQNSGLIDYQDQYLKQVFFNQEFDKYWNWLSSEIFNLTNYDISKIDNSIFRYSFLNIHKIKNKTNITLNGYYQSIQNEEILDSKRYNISSDELNHIIIIHLFARVLTDCEYSKFKTDLKQETKNMVIDLYHILVPASIKHIKKVA